MFVEDLDHARQHQTQHRRTEVKTYTTHLLKLGLADQFLRRLELLTRYSIFRVERKHLLEVLHGELGFEDLDLA